MKRIPLLVFVPLYLSGCALTDLPELSFTDVPQMWQGPVIEEAEVWPETDWWNAFNDEELSELIATVQENNLDLEINQRNLESAQIALREAGFNLLPIPVVSLGTGANYIETDINGVETSGSTDVPFELGASFAYNDILSCIANVFRQHGSR